LNHFGNPSTMAQPGKVPPLWLPPQNIRLGVNIDHIATLRQARGGTTAYPSLLFFADECRQGGADQITIHLREDRRHIQDRDLEDLCRVRLLSLNLEMAATDEMLAIALMRKPDWVCFVPEKREELTTEGGLDVASKAEWLRDATQKLASVGTRVSMFIESDIRQVEASARTGAHAVEFHTGHWVMKGSMASGVDWSRLEAAAMCAQEQSLSVHAGHGLDYSSARRIKKLPHLVEVNIGHFLVCDGLVAGLRASVMQMVQILNDPNIE